MRITELSVTNYRSITVANKLSIQEYTVLIGKNNEGKSNLLSALNLAMTIIMRYQIINQMPLRRYVKQMIDYSWERDFPRQLQGRKSGLESRFRVTFQLEGAELTEFHDTTGIRGNEAIPIEIKIGKEEKVRVSIPKQRTKAYTEKADIITEFISKRISVNYVQAVRTEEMALRAMEHAITNEIRVLEDNVAYRQAWKTITDLQQQVMDDVASRLLEPIKTFLPDLKKIRIQRRNEENESFPVPRFEVKIDDGIETNITEKGDGIKSLVAMAVLNGTKRKTGASLIAVEEPESHLHSGAIHSLVEVLQSMSRNNQIIITTHSPLFVQRNKLEANILVDKRKAHSAKSIEEIRTLLGVVPSDNLTSARYVLLVEGEEDRVSLLKLLPFYSSKIEAALNNNLLYIKPMNGASALTHDALELKNMMCRYVALLDNDQAAKAATEKATKYGYIKADEIRQCICNGENESEFEDCILPSWYEPILKEKYQISIMEQKDFRNGKKKWSDRMATVFRNNGLQWTKERKSEVKSLIAEHIRNNATNKDEVLIEEKSGFIKNLVVLMEDMISEEQ